MEPDLPGPNIEPHCAWISIGTLRCYDDYGQNKIIQINSSKENFSFINNRVSNTMSNRKGMKM